MILCRVTRSRAVRRILHLMKNPLVGLAILLLAGSGLGAVPQAPAPDELAARMTGHWKLNRELSPDLAKPAPGRGRRGGARRSRGPGGASRGAAETAALSLRGEMPAGDEAEARRRRALAPFRMPPAGDSTPSRSCVTRPRGPSRCQIDGKGRKGRVPVGVIKIQSKWEWRQPAQASRAR